MQLRDRSKLNHPDRLSYSETPTLDKPTTLDKTTTLDKSTIRNKRPTLVSPNNLIKTHYPKKKTPPNMNLFVSRVDDVPNDPYQFLSPRDLKVLAATNSFEKRNSKSKNMKYFLILLNILVIVWCYHHLLYQCNFDQSTHIPHLHHKPKFNYESIDSL